MISILLFLSFDLSKKAENVVRRGRLPFTGTSVIYDAFLVIGTWRAFFVGFIANQNIWLLNNTSLTLMDLNFKGIYLP